jgi:hypothetical protein
MEIPGRIEKFGGSNVRLVIVGSLLVLASLMVLGSGITEVLATARHGSDLGEVVAGIGVIATILLVPGCFLVHFGSRRRALAVFLLPGIVFVLLHWMAVRTLFDGSDTWDTALLLLMNLVVDGLAVTFLAVGLYPVVRRLKVVGDSGRPEDAWARVACLAVVALTVGLAATEITVNNRHRDSIAGQLKSRDPAVRITAARELARTGYTGALPSMSAALHDPIAEVRLWAARALGKSESRDAAAPLRGALSDGDPEVRLAVVEALQSLWTKRREPLPVKELAQLIDIEALNGPKEAAARLLESGGGDEADTVFIQALRRGDLMVVAAAHGFYVRRGEPGSEPAVVRALQQYGTKDMAVVLLNCGNTVLADAARAWARERGYKIEVESGRAPAVWGASHR